VSRSTEIPKRLSGAPAKNFYLKVHFSALAPQRDSPVVFRFGVSGFFIPFFLKLNENPFWKWGSGRQRTRFCGLFFYTHENEKKKGRHKVGDTKASKYKFGVVREGVEQLRRLPPQERDTFSLPLVLRLASPFSSRLFYFFYFWKTP
jgi:hypothetical protein